MTDPTPGNVAPVAAVSATPTTGTFPLTVAFDSASSTDSDGTIVSRTWTFGDGGTGSGTAPSHAYTTAGSYTAVLTVTDDDGATNTAAVTITVTDPTPPPPGDATIEISPIADTYVYAAQASTNFGTDSGLVIRDVTGGAANRTAYLRFDVSPIPDGVTVASAVLHLAPVSGGAPALTVKVHTVTGAWEELTVTWNTKPTTGALLGSISVLGANVYHQLDLTSHVNALYTAGTAMMNIALLDDTAANLLVRFGSSNGATKRPKLVVTYSTTPPPPPPDPPEGEFPVCQTLDAYRGCNAVPTAHPELNGYFRTEKLGNRWWFMTPEGHAFLALSVSVLNANGTDGEDSEGKTYEDHASAKYGGFPANRPAWANATLDKLRQLGFNTIGTFSHNIFDASDGVAERLPWIPTVRITNNVVLDDLVGNIWEDVKTGGTFPDLYHPGFEAAVEAEAATLITPEMIADPYVLYYFPDQADELRGIAHNHASLCWGAWVGKPTLAISGGTATNYLKAKLAADMQTKYTTIAALNAAWGTAYTTFGSAGGHGTGHWLLGPG